MEAKSPELVWLALAYLFHSRPAQIIRLIEMTDDVSKLHDFSPLRTFNEWERCERDLATCARTGIEIVGYLDERYPPLLRMIHDPPVMLFARGDIASIQSRPCVAMVGARKATPAGKAVARRVARDLASAGWTVVSGMAYGIDGAAHEGALEGGGRTVAVWGSGPDIIYPRAHRMLADRILEKGAALTEFPLGMLPAPYHFPQRNRIISGISLGVVVVEGAQSSGSLITARYAMEQGRDVCALPWGAGLVMGRGTNGLIQDGAALVENAQDVIEALSGANPQMCERKKSRQVKAYAGTESRPARAGGSESDDPLISMFEGSEAMSLDELIQQSGLSASKVLEKMTQLELEGFVEELPGKRYTLKRD